MVVYTCIIFLFLTFCVLRYLSGVYKGVLRKNELLLCKCDVKSGSISIYELYPSFRLFRFMSKSQCCSVGPLKYGFDIAISSLWPLKQILEDSYTRKCIFKLSCFSAGVERAAKHSALYIMGQLGVQVIGNKMCDVLYSCRVLVVLSLCM